MSTYIAIAVGAILGAGFGKAIYFPRPRRRVTVTATEPTANASSEARQFFLSLA